MEVNSNREYCLSSMVCDTLSYTFSLCNNVWMGHGTAGARGVGVLGQLLCAGLLVHVGLLVLLCMWCWSWIWGRWCAWDCRWTAGALVHVGQLVHWDCCTGVCGTVGACICGMWERPNKYPLIIDHTLRFNSKRACVYTYHLYAIFSATTC